MGCDGGTIPTRDELVRLKKKPEQKDKESELSFRWRHCAITQLPLQSPIVACGLGRLYCKESVLEGLLDRTKLPELASHITSLKDIRELVLTANPAYFRDVKGEKGESGRYVDHRASPYICPVIGLELSGMFRFVFPWSCGCVISEKALKAAPSKLCHKCQKPVTPDEYVVLNAEGDSMELMQARLEARKAEAKAKKKNKKQKAVATVTTSEITSTSEAEKTAPIDPEPQPCVVTAEVINVPEQNAETKKIEEVVAVKVEKSESERSEERKSSKRSYSPDNRHDKKEKRVKDDKHHREYRDERKSSKSKDHRSSKDDHRSSRDDRKSKRKDHHKSGKIESISDPAYKKSKSEYSVANDPRATKVYKSLFTTHNDAKNQTKAHWVTYNPFYN